ncbi:hypothetical protein Tco_0833648 [Tanacetum coccineum]
MYTFSPMMVANSRKHHCRVRSYTREVLVISTNLDIQKNHYPLDFRNRRGDEARIKNTWYKRRCCSLIPAKSNSLPHAHAQTTKTYYWHQDSRIKKAQVHTKTKTFANSDIQDLPLIPQVYQGRLLAGFQDDAKYNHVGQDTRSQDDKDDQDKQGKELKIPEIKTKVERQ